MTATPGAMVERYNLLREAKKILRDRFKNEEQLLNDELNKLEIEMLQKMQEQGVTSFPTANGTAYQAQQNNLKVLDWEAALDYIKRNGQWQLLNKSINKPAAMEVFEEDDGMPGVKLDRTIVVRIRK